MEKQWVNELQRALPGVAISRVEDWHFEFHSAYELLTEQLKVRSLKGFDCEDLQSAIRAGGAALNYLRENQRGAIGHINRLTRKRTTEYMLLDATAQRNLDLLSNQQDGSKEGALLGVIDRTLTPMGARLIRQWIVAPLKDPAAICQRLDAGDAGTAADLRAPHPSRPSPPSARLHHRPHFRRVCYGCSGR